MGFFDLDSDRIVRIFHANGLRMSLKKAFEVSNIIYTAHLDRLNEVENNIWTVARQEANERVTVARIQAFEDGKAVGARDVHYQAAGEHATALVEATMWTEENISFGNLSQKIRCIKELRNKFPTLGLRDCKTIIDRATGNGIGLHF
ncbi:hypothetical protein SEA_EVY_242 [Streptomyces phage Evy]|uniref:Uncharacterized protein n=1 Tax=Streptomyces phage Evy TaxID=2588514 RepID=A0A514DJS6_9CAUD|nr:hypothetical protein KNU67_gp004 [Streptomyces phage Evy]YP_010103585.1 hypothetical protein KNU67_gp056 [Streptomyces phage Evy]UEM46793.1 hypothetical protein SEA_TARGARYEN_4 [Streptomyces phage Targaryen]QDH93873.1 hypothetical protein SEA_EVY_4 [Streptomyces phage Evy]QDH94076.1 hypothetical protein SEA_EVY_242 [Streptomyces phage Evy]UEM47000.1 hypothetical protein SEA_TARGARYEN_255 [Streptomyces phage Targaryen]